MKKNFVSTQFKCKLLVLKLRYNTLYYNYEGSQLLENRYSNYLRFHAEILDY